MTLTVIGRLYAGSAAKRELKGMLLPFGIPGYTSAGRLLASAGTVKWPADLSKLAPANLDHNGETPVGHWQSIEETPEGLVASWHVPETPNGDRLLAEYAAGLRTGVSVELADGFVVRQGKLVAGELESAGFVVKPAFDTARLTAGFVKDAGGLRADYETESESETVDTYVDEAGNTVTVTTTRVITEKVEETPAAPVEGDPDDPDAPPTTTTEETDDVNTNLTAAKRQAVPAGGRAPGEPASLRAFLAAVATGNARRDGRMLASLNETLQGSDQRLLAALSDITATQNEGTLDAPQWLGELWSGVAYERRIVPLVSAGVLSGYTLKGWKWVTKPVVAPYAGDKAPVPSNPVETEPVEISAERLAGAHDIDRKYRDFNDESFFASYYAAMSESYARLSDAALVQDLVAGATPITAGSVPAGVSSGLSLIVDGALELIEEGVPTFALAAPDVYRDILLTPYAQRVEMVSASLGLREGQAAGLTILPWKGIASGKALVGIKAAATFYELPGVPIRAEAVDMVKGGIDAGVFGYYATNVHDADGLVLVSKPAA